MRRPLRHRHRYALEARLALNPMTPEMAETGRCYGWAALAMMAVSAISQGMAQQKQGEAAAEAADYQAAVARNNQIISQQNAEYARQKGVAMEGEKRQDASQILGHQRARMGASGITLDSGSPLRLQEDVARLGEVDALTIRNNAAREAYGWEAQGTGYAAEATLDEAKSRNARDAGSLNMFTSIIGGASSVSNKWMQYKQAGVDMGSFGSGGTGLGASGGGFDFGNTGGFESAGAFA